MPPEHDEDDDGFTPLARYILDFLAEQAETSMVTETAVDVGGPFDVEELAQAIRAFFSGPPSPKFGF